MMGKRITMEEQDIFKYLGYVILYNGNTILRKLRQNMKAAINQVHILMSKFLRALNLFLL